MGFATAPLIATRLRDDARLPPEHVPGRASRRRIPSCARRFKGQPEHVVNFFFFIAEEVRQIMARLGIAKFEDLTGRVDLLEADEAIEHWQARGIDLSRGAAGPARAARRRASPHQGRRSRRSPTRSTGS